MGTSVSQSKAVSLYKHPKQFFILSTLIPWVLWFAAGFVSRITPYEDKYLNIASILAFIGLLAPIAVAFIFIAKEPMLRKDVSGRFFNFRKVKPLYLLLACLIIPGSILLAQSISLLFGYSHEQFIITGEFIVRGFSRSGFCLSLLRFWKNLPGILTEQTAFIQSTMSLKPLCSSLSTGESGTCHWLPSVIITKAM